MNMTVVKIFHLIAFAHFLVGTYCSWVLKLPAIRGLDFFMTQNSGKLVFLTFLNMVIQATYFTIALLNDIIGTNEVLLFQIKPSKIRKLRDYFFAAFAFPVALNVGIAFWSLFAIDRELVFPKDLDVYYPNWLNHVMHTNVVFFIIIELFTSFHSYPKRTNGLAGLIAFSALYIAWLHVIKYASGIWIYPLFDFLSLQLRLAFFAMSLIFSAGLYIFGEFVNEKIWAKETKHALKGASEKVN